MSGARVAWLALLCAALPTVAAAQSSQFGVRGLGMPGHGWTARAAGSAGAFGQLDALSAINPATIGLVDNLAVTFTGVQSYRTSTNPAGSADAQDTRFPLVGLVAPIRGTRATASLSYSIYSDRDFALATVDTVDAGGGTVVVNDTLRSLGGMSDLRLAVSLGVGSRWNVGAAAHLITGTNRIDIRRTFSDTLFNPSRQRSELTISGWGFSAGIMGSPLRGVQVALMVRSDGTADVERDSTTASKYPVALPLSIAGSVAWRPSSRLAVAGAYTRWSWSDANEDLQAVGAAGAANSYEASGGVEFATRSTRPGQLPLRLGVRYRTLPFLLEGVEQPRETAVAAGTSLVFAYGRAGMDLAAERASRSAGSAYRETAWLFRVGVTVRP